jgi:hypothetical protein
LQKEHKKSNRIKRSPSPGEPSKRKTTETNNMISPPRSGEDTPKKGIDEEMVPEEIDTHFKLFGKHAWEVKYSDRCPICGSRIDEYGFCACGSQGE